MKKFLALLLVLMTLALPAFAEDALNVYVSITDDTGALVLACEAVAVTDTDADGALTISDALCCAHAAKHAEGAEAYGTAATEYGLSMTKLWGVENGGSYGYCLNNASAWNLLDPIAEGDHVKAYCYTDLTTWSDTYCFFDADMKQAKAGEAAALTLSAAGYDENWSPITVPVEGAAILVNGQDVETVTDAEGNASITLTEAGVYTISAMSASQTLVAPVCIITVE